MSFSRSTSTTPDLFSSIYASHSVSLLLQHLELSPHLLAYPIPSPISHPSPKPSPHQPTRPSFPISTHQQLSPSLFAALLDAAPPTPNKPTSLIPATSHLPSISPIAATRPASLSISAHDPSAASSVPPSSRPSPLSTSVSRTPPAPSTSKPSSLPSFRTARSRLHPRLRKKTDPPVSSSPKRQRTLGLKENKSAADRDLPQVPNVDPVLVEMIVNEVLDLDHSVHWDHIAGLSFAKQCIKEAIIWPLQRPDLFQGLRGPPKGVMLFGPPGTGKTMIGKAIASETGARFFNISASSVMSKWIGQGEKMVRALFGVARAMKPSVVFIDEIDSLLTARTDGEQDATRRVKTEFLVQMDGAGTSRDDGVLVVGATNRPQELDDAARRRMVKRLYIPLPDDQARLALLKTLLVKLAHGLSQQDMNRVVTITKGYSGSDLYAVCSEAAMQPVRDLGEKVVTVKIDDVRPLQVGDFEKALKTVRASVDETQLGGYVEWNRKFGSFPATDEE